jgi:uncharacterized lipoprotein YddW (UPF0748 family)
MNVKIICLIVLLFSGLPVSAQTGSEIRAVWLTVNHNLDWPQSPIKSMIDLETSKESLDLMLDKLKTANINVVFFQTRIRGCVVYPSEIEPFAENLRSRYSPVEFDALQYAIEACHRRGMELHAWFVVYPLGQKPPSTLENSAMVTKYNKGFYLNPGHPQTTTYLVKLISELVSNYDIDGLHFDYIRYPEGSARFPDADLHKRYAHGQSLAAWRRENINNFVHKAFDEVKRQKPWIAVSSSVAGMYDFIPGNGSRHWTALHSVFQDPVEWIESGKHDFIVPMLYNRDRLFFPFVEDWIKRVGAERIIGGLGLYMVEESGWNPEVVAEQIDFLRQNDAAGSALFRARNLTDNPRGAYTLISSKSYPDPTLPPPLPDRRGKKPATPENFVALARNNYLFLTWDSPDNTEPLSYNIYRSETTPVDINNPKNLLAVKMKGEGCKIRIDNSLETVYYYTVTAFDRYRSESIACEDVIFVTGDFEK